MIYHYYFWGMHILWWFVWMAMIFWIFAIPYDIPGQRNRVKSPLHVLQDRLAAGKITVVEYEDAKKVL